MVQFFFPFCALFLDHVGIHIWSPLTKFANYNCDIHDVPCQYLFFSIFWFINLSYPHAPFLVDSVILDDHDKYGVKILARTLSPWVKCMMPMMEDKSTINEGESEKRTEKLLKRWSVWCLWWRKNRWLMRVSQREGLTSF